MHFEAAAVRFGVGLALAVAAGRLSANELAATNPWVAKIRGQLGLMQQKTFVSRTIGMSYGYLLYLPPDYEKASRKRFPVVYYLHGMGGDAGVARFMVERLDPAIRAGRAPSLIVVSCSDATGQSCWCDSKDGRYPVETVIIRDLIPHVDSAYRTIARREGRALEGFSMGGLGSARLALKYPDRFCGFSIMSTAMPTAEKLKEWQPDLFQQTFGGDLEYCRANLPWALTGQHADVVRGQMHIRIRAGANDPKKTGCERFHEFLTGLKIKHDFALVPKAGHDLSEMYQNFAEDPFAFYRQMFSQ